MIKKILSNLLLLVLIFFSAHGAFAAELQPGQLVKSTNFAEVFVVTDDSVLRWIPDEKTFNALGYDWERIIVVADEVLLQYPFGDSLLATSTPSVPLTPAQIEARIREFFPDNPEMVEIARCESGFRQFNNDGSVLRGSRIYIGIFQIDENIHANYAKSLGMDIFTVEGNLAYAKHLLETSGTRPWGCAPKAFSALSKYTLTKDLRFEDTDQEVKTVQIILNTIGFPVAATGVGSAGSETNYFGALTRSAVQRFQCAKGIVCSGDETTTGYGQVGPRTRTLLLQLAP